MEHKALMAMKTEQQASKKMKQPSGSTQTKLTSFCGAKKVDKYPTNSQR